ncbi:calcium/calmodulin-regulated receptor-like kinase 1 [Ananas comosus]|uniref:Calcium/calmodulin-regulated receptor-like kinase 1 n=1 Tax=Ananas comosus TaxID=4615 RepID=A0A6P5G2N9_ANACO|nr:calcium/calmodulin-regulated receptor-like kinase 1 [Ananas comosus]XP_020102650.1 calcium/calmodulin-regulated receptor-like kinase 1 [Ananas comosus]XP_020102651.1 calcium/calmodulin-regulated receptor-like kinase 1 [Ananas comosus]XP_020102652.1 calcium/calmodulin-regulated receptor-like kinase 1 [Ananas comosus]XP_020102653.1 calcium/calmodulin-regulated receptor-like kinase 1 [Ananas comosus]
MKGVSWGLIIGVTIGVVIGALLATGALFCFMFHRKRSQIGNSSSRRASTIPFCANGVDNRSEFSDSTAGQQDSPKTSQEQGSSLWLEGNKMKNLVSVSGVLKYSFKDLQKATGNFTTLIGQGAFGPVYKAQMSTGETVAVKVLATDSKQGEKEFQNEVLLLGRLHHRNLVNLVGYCAEKGQHMLIYVYMPNGSLASHLYGENRQLLSWDLRVSIALDVARGLEYLHDGAIPPVIHRDVKSNNILLDRSMKARVADFGLSREEMVSNHVSHIRGTFGYLDPEYVSSRSFTKKSDVYSFGVLLFELITGRNPQQGLMEYVELAAINAEGRVGWEEIVDSRLDGAFDVEELNDIAAVAYKCVSRISRKRPSMRDVVQALSRIVKLRHSRKSNSRRLLSTVVDDESTDLEAYDHQSTAPEHRREESIDSISDLPDV